MLKILRCDDPAQIGVLLRRAVEEENIDTAVAEILRAVRARGDAALFEYTERFDGVRLASLAVAEEEIDAAMETVDKEFLDILHRAAENIRAYHKRQRQIGYVVADRPGIVMGQRVLPLDRVGIYVPGGTASYPSTVLMDAIPATIAGVPEITVVTPPGQDGAVRPEILAAARIAGVRSIYKVGGAQAIAALAYGTQSIPKVDKIAGPGNIYVAAAKRMVYGKVDIDMIAGPSEILIIADETADPEALAADMLAQAEHDRNAASILVTTSETLAQTVQKAIAVSLEKLPRKEIAAYSLEQNGMAILTSSLESAAAICNEMAPEHLELCVREPFGLLPLIRNAASVFLGHYAPEALGDYFAGPNHTLPTSGTARFASPLSVDDFVKKSSFLYYSKEAFAEIADQVETFARREGLDAHGNSIAVRLRADGDDQTT